MMGLLLRYLLPQRGLAALMTLLVIAAVGLQLLVPQLLRRFNKIVVAERITKTFREKMHFVSKSEQRKEKRRRAERNRRKKAMQQGH